MKGMCHSTPGSHSMQVGSSSKLERRQGLAVSYIAVTELRSQKSPR